MNLVIVESPSKSKTLESYLGKGYTVAASMGHIRDLPKSKLGVDVENNFAEIYEIPPSKKKTISSLKKLVKEADTIYLATDPDREGEAISWHLQEILKDLSKSKRRPIGNSAKKDSSRFKRVVFHEITKGAVLSAFEHPRDIDIHLVDAQRARRILDRLVGYKLSPLLWKKIRYGLSAGRVQSVAVRFVVERQKEIDAFKSAKFYEIEVSLKNPPDQLSFNAQLTHINGETIYVRKKYPLFAGDYATSQTSIDTEEKSSLIKKDLIKSVYKIDAIDEKEYQKAPKPPFTTSSMQQEASWRLGFSPKKTMSCAQKLYEKGLITYMRTDSTNLSNQSLDAIRALIVQGYGKDYLPENPKFYKTKVKVAQEAHEAIRPTDVKKTVSNIKSLKIADPDQRLYEMIWQRTVSCQMSSAVYSGITIKVLADSGRDQYFLNIKDSAVKFPGWQAVYKKSQSLSLEPSYAEKFKKLSVSQQLEFLSTTVIEKQTAAPPYYNEASLIKELEKFGIGRPSTYAPIMSTIQDRGYVQKAEGKLKPTDSGTAVTKLLVENFSEIMDVNFTAKMEDDLDEIAIAKKNLVSVINDFYVPFDKLLNEKQDSINKANYTVLETLDEKCPKCKNPLIVKLGKYGRFISCSNYPKCEYLRSIVETVGIKCPKCKSGDLIVRRTKKGKTFYGCSNYPKCDFAVWKLEELKKAED